jgi:hypothetical protein
VGIFYSHFEVVKRARGLVIRIMLYHSELELVVDSFIFDNYLEFKNFFRGKFLNLNISFMLLLIFWCFFLDLKKSLKQSEKIKKLLKNNFEDSDSYFKVWRGFDDKANLSSYELKKKAFFKEKAKFLRSLKSEEEEDEDTLDTKYPKIYLLFDILYLLTVLKDVKNRNFITSLNKFFSSKNLFLLISKKTFFFFLGILRVLNKKIEKLKSGGLKGRERVDI